MSNVAGSVTGLKRLNIAFTAMGTRTFAALWFYLTFSQDDFFSRAEAFAVTQVSERVTTFSPFAASGSPVGGLAQRVQDDLANFSDGIAAGSSQERRALVVDTLVAMCELDCTERAEAEARVNATFERLIPLLEARTAALKDRFQTFVSGEFRSILAELLRDFRIFAGTNTILMALALGLAVFKGRAAAHLVPISIVLTLSTALASYWYIAGTDWVYTVLFSNHWGYGYTVLAALIALHLADIGLDRARVTTAEINFVGSALGGLFSVLPC